MTAKKHEPAKHAHDTTKETIRPKALEDVLAPAVPVEPAPKPPAFKVGDHVIVRGGPVMTVIGDAGEGFTCVWFASGDVKTFAFPVDALTRAT